MNHLPNSTAARDIATLIHPYTNLDRHMTAGPLVMTRGEGVYVFDDSGKRYLEGMAGLWSVSLGFGEQRLVDAATRQMQALPYSQLFGHRSHEPAIELAEKLLAMAPAGLDKVLFANSGSEANDQAAKLVWYYHNAIGKPRKKKIIARTRGYHGVTVYSGSLTGLPANHADFDLPVGGVLRADCPSHYLFGQPGEGEAAFVDRIVGNLEQLILREDPETIGAFIAEPVQGSGGVIVPPKGYFEKVQALLRRYDILFIADEVICGFGRTGQMFGCETFDIRPDIVTVAKQLSSSYIPISATLVSRPIFEGMLEESRKQGVFAHGFTYSGHPVAAAVALETLKIYEERDTIGHVQRVMPHFQSRLHALAEHPLVGEARGIGLIGAIEIVQDKRTRKSFAAADGIPAMAAAATLRHGVIARAIRDAIAFCPPLIISEAEIDELFDGVRHGLDEALAHARAKGLVSTS
ncbi:aspartate aminotransferase family protein [Limobrevibacterium gyesilva]|uniref:Aspartate aminotransferase family protein n=1 Tax=Limobrevibacterium gyesilva TaxID=2991712 RepID=A0AA41YIV3_9PROT|nr:aspartate aminotransferase family protein [Limobrevibacterium gyesilva]MCW3473295.1 aspartate aminotransferase family protein [Limobrevibacterium gyesilva]